MEHLSAHDAIRRAYEDLGALADRERVEEYRLGRTADVLIREAGGYEGKRVLELGSSVGVHAIAASLLGAKTVVGVDKFVFPDTCDSPFRLSVEALKTAQTIWARHRIDIQPHDLAERLPYADGSFDLVVCNAVIEHCHGIHKQLFAEVHRVLAPGGRFVFTTPNLAMLLKRVRFFLGKSPLWDLKDYFESGHDFTGHVREFTVEECKQMLTWSGMEPVYVKAQTGYWKRSWLMNPRKWRKVMFAMVSRLSSQWGDLIYAVGRKP
ncbi:MAG: class I SAM-dependent methyltransferase [Patescibacteria group bacterium]